MTYRNPAEPLREPPPPPEPWVRNAFRALWRIEFVREYCAVAAIVVGTLGLIVGVALLITYADSPNDRAGCTESVKESAGKCPYEGQHIEVVAEGPTDNDYVCRCPEPAP